MQLEKRAMFLHTVPRIRYLLKASRGAGPGRPSRLSRRRAVSRAASGVTLLGSNGSLTVKGKHALHKETNGWRMKVGNH
ncbi:hypothetical protein EYF80_018375 [Liparis tanakae]|uniref:Uncharacterized protein n=1 Tax=Liparis tanakae TaxID=230148 RepID=A0A4Z2I064_9TELE|nr:hypothetical protein EYF80_018375 [Liparis tanakae]